MKRLAWTLALAGLFGASGCDSTTVPPVIDFSGVEGFTLPDGGEITDMVRTDDGPLLNEDGGGDPDGPTITILKPALKMEVPAAPLLVQANIVAMAGRTLISDSVKLTVPTPTGGEATTVMSLTGMPNVYEGTGDVSALTGNTNLAVEARDSAGKMRKVFVQFAIDRGPAITFKQPTASTAKGSISVELEIKDLLHPVASGDIKATVRPGDNIVFTVSQVSTAGTTPYIYSALATVDFNSYAPPLDGQQLITAEAKNSSGTRITAQKQFIVDNNGPVINITNPKAGDFVGGVVEIKADITDLSALVPTTVIAVFANDPVNYKVGLTQTTPGGSEYHGFFDVRGLAGNHVLPSLSVRADDVLGNHGEYAHQIIVDTTRMSMELDPPNLRLRKPVDVGQGCSWLFDPLGADAINDLQVVQQIMTVRARVEDHGNLAPGLQVERFSGIDPASVRLFAVPVTGIDTALVVTNDADSMCDDINPKLVPTSAVTMSGQALSLQMVDIPTNGLADFTNNNPISGPPVDPFVSPWPELGCTRMGDDSPTPPPPFCAPTGSPLQKVIARHGDKVGAIWTLPPVFISPPTGCLGFQLDSLNTLPEGPTCLAVRAMDYAGNINVTPPIRVCIDRGGGKCTAGLWNAGTYPDCTGRYDKVTDTVDHAAVCTPFNSAALINAPGYPYDGQPVFQTRFRGTHANPAEIRDQNENQM